MRHTKELVNLLIEELCERTQKSDGCIKHLPKDGNLKLKKYKNNNFNKTININDGFMEYDFCLMSSK